MLDPSQPVLGWYDQSGVSKNQGVGTYHDVAQSGDIFRGKPVAHAEAQIIRRNYYAATSYSDAQLGTWSSKPLQFMCYSGCG